MQGGTPGRRDQQRNLLLGQLLPAEAHRHPSSSATARAPSGSARELPKHAVLRQLRGEGRAAVTLAMAAGLAGRGAAAAGAAWPGLVAEGARAYVVPAPLRASPCH